MANIDIKTEVIVPEEIRINLIREDFLDTSHTFRIFFEVCLGITCAIFGCILSNLSNEAKVDIILWVFFTIMVLGSASFLYLTHNSYQKAKSQASRK